MAASRWSTLEVQIHAKLWGDKMGETIRRIKVKAKSAFNKALLIKNAVFGNLEGQEVKGKIQENVEEDSELVKDKAKQQQEMAAQKAEEVKETVSQNARNAKETTTNNRRKKVINERKVIEESKEL